jgi:hypothetical protein
MVKTQLLLDNVENAKTALSKVNGERIIKQVQLLSAQIDAKVKDAIANNASKKLSIVQDSRHGFFDFLVDWVIQYTHEYDNCAVEKTCGAAVVELMNNIHDESLKAEMDHNMEMEFQDESVGMTSENAMTRPRPITDSGEFDIKEMPNPKVKVELSVIDSDADYSGLPQKHVDKLVDIGARRYENFITFDKEINETTGQSGKYMKAINAWLAQEKRGTGEWQTGTHGAPDGTYGRAKQLDSDFFHRDACAARNNKTNWGVKWFTNPLPEIYGPGKFCVLAWCFSTASLARQRP